MNPLELRGPEFLLFYVVALMVAAAMALALRERSRGPADDDPRGAGRLSTEDAAYLAGGLPQVLQLGLAELIKREHVELDATTSRLRALKPLTREASEAMRTLHRIIDASGSMALKDLEAGAAAAWAGRYDRLVREGLMLSHAESLRARLLGLAPAALLLLVGATKINIGISRDRPVGYLLVLCCVTVVLMAGYFAAPLKRSRRGDRHLEALRARNVALRETAHQDPDRLGYADFSMAVALYGVDGLGGSQMSRLQQALHPAASRSGGSGDAGTGCSSGGGGSCGGGCGGGGCGGCGS